MRKFAAFDIDGTLVRWQLYHAIADALVKLGYVRTDVYEPMRLARMDWKRREEGASFQTYELEVIKTYEQALLNLSKAQFQEAVNAVFNEYKDQVYIYTRDLIQDLKQKNYLLFAISGSQIEIVQKIASYYGFDDYSGTTYLHRKGRFTGEKIFNAASKDKILKDFIKKHNCSLKESIALGDGASDIKMLEMVELPVAFNPERRLFEHTKSKDWKIVIERKNMIYELESTNGTYKLKP